MIKLLARAARASLALALVAAFCVPTTAWAENGSTPSGATDATGSVALEEGAAAAEDNGSAHRVMTTQSMETSSGKLAEENATLSVQAHVQKKGWMAPVGNGVTCGTTGEYLRLEAVKVKVSGVKDLSVRYRSHVQNQGWHGWVTNGMGSGTLGKSLRVEAIRIELTGSKKSDYDIYYRLHVQDFGWMGWAKNGAEAGSSACSKRVEALQVKLVKKGEAAPSTAEVAYIDASKVPTTATIDTRVGDSTSWLSAGLGATAGTTGQSKVLTAMKITVKNAGGVTGAFAYKTHLSHIGWTDTVRAGAVSGKSTKTNSVEAVQIAVNGNLKKYYDVYYRAHVSHVGWLDWAKNGQSAGSMGVSLPMEALQVKLVVRNGKAPGKTAAPLYTEKSLTGDRTLDKKIKSMTTGKTLLECFNWFKSQTHKYVGSRSYHVPTSTWATKEARRMLLEGGGDCYGFAAAFYYMALQKGYQARLVSGTVPRTSGGAAEHGWVEVMNGGVWKICDPDLGRQYPSLKFYMQSPGASTVTYTAVHR